MGTISAFLKDESVFEPTDIQAMSNAAAKPASPSG
jgi:hypothetical protein